MSAHWMDGADEPLRAALARNGEIARGLAGMAEPPIHAQESCRACGGAGVLVVTVGHEPSGPGDPGCHEEEVVCACVVAPIVTQESEREPDCRDLAAGLATAARGGGVMSIELKPCPFCGGDAAFGTSTYTDKTVREQKWKQRTFHFVSCTRCGTRNEGPRGWVTQERAAEHWNRRNPASGDVPVAVDDAASRGTGSPAVEQAALPESGPVPPAGRE
jgi:hypothetical protein